MERLSRRRFLRHLAAIAGGVVIAGPAAACRPAAGSAARRATEPPTPPPTTTGPAPVDLAVARGPEPAELTRRALTALGGIERFVGPGANVIVKPNICTAGRSYEYAATTNPEVVATLVRLCLGAGARRVRVMDQPFMGTAAAAYEQSGIAEAVKAAGGEMELMADMKYRQVDIPDGRDLKRWKVYGDILDADVVINVPVAKDHGNTRLTLGGKNLMGVVVDREAFHRNLGPRIADIVSVVRPALTVIDAVRILLANGPTGGSLGDVKAVDTVIASADIVAADAWATGLFDLQPDDVPYIPAEAAMGIGTMDIKSIRIEEIQVG